MIKIIQNSSVTNHEVESNSIIFVTSNGLLKYKNKYVNKDVLVTTIKNVALKIVNKYSDKKLVSDEASYILMDEAFNNIKNNLKRYNNVNDITFNKELINTYQFYSDNKLLSNDKINDLKLIYEEYEKVLEKNNLVSISDVYKILNNNIENIEYDNIYFENVTNLTNDNVEFINKLKETKNVVIYANTINNESLVKELNEISNIHTEYPNNNDITNLYKIGSKNLFKDVMIVGANDLYEEVKFVSNDIRKNINNGLKYKDILVVSSDVKRYDKYFKLLFNFPYQNEIIKGTVTNDFINIFSDVLNGNFSCANFISMLKLGVYNLDNNIIDKLDNYVYMWNLESKPFYDEFIYNPNGNRTLRDNDTLVLDKLNNVRINVINPIRYLLENIVKEDNVTMILKYIFTYLDEEGITSYLSINDEDGYNSMVNNFEIINDYYKCASISSILNLLNEMQCISTGNKKMLDEVNVCKLDNYVSNHYKLVYFIGVTEKDIPSKFKYDTLINNNDLDNDTVYNLITMHNDKETNLVSNVLLNNNVIITYHKLTDEGSKINCSDLLNKFYNKPIMYKYQINKPNNNILSNMIDKDVAEKLYGTDLFLSPTSLEMYASCKYAYFLKYGLGLNIKEKLTFDKREVGTYVHYILEKCISNNVSKDNISELVNKYTDEYFNINLKPFNNTVNYVIERLKSSTIELLNIMLDELSNTKLKPKDTEFKIKDIPLNIKLNNGTLRISGIVDRIDWYEENNKRYFRIIDYKTGNKEFRLDDVTRGLNIQMLIYLLSIRNSNKNNIPTGFLYYHALINNKISSYTTNNKEVTKNTLDGVKMNGILNKDYLSLYNDNTMGDYIDVKLKDKINEEKVFNSEDLETIFNEVLSVLTEEGNNILDGDIRVNPINDGKNDSCKYCKFNSVCKFDKNVDNYRKYKAISNRKALSDIRGDNNELD